MTSGDKGVTVVQDEVVTEQSQRPNVPDKNKPRATFGIEACRQT